MAGEPYRRPDHRAAEDRRRRADQARGSRKEARGGEPGGVEADRRRPEEVRHLNDDDTRWMGAALALAERGRGLTAPNPNVGCVIVNQGRVVGRGWTQPGGRPHAEAMALAEAGEKSRGATVHTTLEPCAHESRRGPACDGLLVAAGVARVVIALIDPDPRTDGCGISRLRTAGINVVTGVRSAE